MQNKYLVTISDVLLSSTTLSTVNTLLDISERRMLASLSTVSLLSVSKHHTRIISITIF